MKLKFILFCLAALTAGSNACFNPADQWAAGVVWTAEEPSVFTVIEQRFTAGVHYLKEGKDFEVAFIYRSHYDPVHTMVLLGYFTMSYQPEPAPRLAVVLDTAQRAETYDFAASVGTELDWLNREGIVLMSAAERQAAEDSVRAELLRRAVQGGDAQYWTLQKDVLPYNMWYTFDTLGGVWGTGGVRAVDGVKGCGLDEAYRVPPEEMPGTGIYGGCRPQTGVRGRGPVAYFTISGSGISESLRNNGICLQVSADGAVRKILTLE